MTSSVPEPTITPEQRARYREVYTRALADPDFDPYGLKRYLATPPNRDQVLEWIWMDILAGLTMDQSHAVTMIPDGEKVWRETKKDIRDQAEANGWERPDVPRPKPKTAEDWERTVEAEEPTFERRTYYVLPRFGGDEYLWRQWDRWLGGRGPFPNQDAEGEPLVYVQFVTIETPGAREDFRGHAGAWLPDVQHYVADFRFGEESELYEVTEAQAKTVAQYMHNPTIHERLPIPAGD